jgi:hypothetical protein
MLADMTVINPETIFDGIKTVHPEAQPFRFRDLSEFPELMKTDQILDPTRTKAISVMSVFSFKCVTQPELDLLLAACPPTIS